MYQLCRCVSESALSVSECVKMYVWGMFICSAIVGSALQAALFYGLRMYSACGGLHGCASVCARFCFGESHGGLYVSANMGEVAIVVLI